MIFIYVYSVFPSHSFDQVIVNSGVADSFVFSLTIDSDAALSKVSEYREFVMQETIEIA